MTGPPPYGTDDDPGIEPKSGPSTPRWLTVLGICIAVVVILAMVVLHLTGTLGGG